MTKKDRETYKIALVTNEVIKRNISDTGIFLGRQEIREKAESMIKTALDFAERKQYLSAADCIGRAKVYLNFAYDLLIEMKEAEKLLQEYDELMYRGRQKLMEYFGNY